MCVRVSDGFKLSSVAYFNPTENSEADGAGPMYASA